MERKLDFESINVGDKVPPLKVTVEREKLLRYCRAMKEVNPLHFDERYAKSLGFRDLVVQGVFTFGCLIKTLTDWIGDPRCIKEIEIRFVSPMYAGDTAVFTGVVTKKIEDERTVECRVWGEREGGEKLIEAVAKLSFK